MDIHSVADPYHKVSGRDENTNFILKFSKYNSKCINLEMKI